MRAEQVIATHGNTDFDAFAAMVAVRRLYPGAVVCLAGSLNRNVREFYRLHADELNAVEASRLELDAIRRLIVVETKHAPRRGELEPVALDDKVEKALFDHHGGELPEWVAPENAVVSADGALTTTLVGVLAERETPVTPVEATVFALAIHEDTGSLLYPSATQRDAEALAWCLRHGASQELLAGYLHTPLAADERELLNAVLAALTTRDAAGIEVLVAALPWNRYVDGISNLAHKVVDLTDCRAFVLLVEMDERVFAVTRSRVPELDASAVAEALGGGGHPEAASAIFRGTLEEAQTRLDERLPGAVREPPRARDVMSTPARCVGPDEAVRHAPVKGIMSSRVATCDEETPLPELQRLLASGDGRVAVLRGSELVGVVTRSDVLRALGERPEARPELGVMLTDELARLEHLAPVFEAVAAVSEPYEGVYLVGGTVRDILLGERGFDVDIAVEGDAIELARRIASELGGRARVHEKFGTAVGLFQEGG